MLKKLNIIVDKISILKKQIDLFRTLSPGDLVWAKMPISKKELLTVEESHRTRPYLIMHKNLFSLFVYSSSSKQSVHSNSYNEYHINRLRYDKNKDSWISFSKLYKLPIFNLKSKYITLNEIDLNGIQKRLQILSEKYNNITFNFNMPIYLSEGDVIVIDKKLYYIYSVDNSNIYAFHIFKKCPNDISLYERIIIDKKIYYTTFNEKKVFQKTDNLKLSNIAFPNEIEIIAKQIKNAKYNAKVLAKSKKSQKNENIYENGTIFKIGPSKVAYLFKYKNIDYGVDLLTYTFKPRIFPIYNISKRPIVEVLSPEKYLQIVEFLHLNKVTPIKPIAKLYDCLRDDLYPNQN